MELRSFLLICKEFLGLMSQLAHVPCTTEAGHLAREYSRWGTDTQGEHLTRRSSKESYFRCVHPAVYLWAHTACIRSEPRSKEPLGRLFQMYDRRKALSINNLVGHGLSEAEARTVSVSIRQVLDSNEYTTSIQVQPCTLSRRFKSSSNHLVWRLVSEPQDILFFWVVTGLEVLVQACPGARSSFFAACHAS